MVHIQFSYMNWSCLNTHRLISTYPDRRLVIHRVRLVRFLPTHASTSEVGPNINVGMPLPVSIEVA